MSKRLTYVAAAVLAALPASAAAQDSKPTLTIGDPAPALRVQEWLKGSPVASFEKNKLYVVEFWATWCGPCRTSIPHLTELQHTYKDVTFVGVSILERDMTKPVPFVESMGDKMDYRVATDIVAEGAESNTGVMATTWFKAAGEDGIPSAFVVNGQGKIAWIGHPMEMDEPLKKIVAGTWDVAAAAKERAEAAELEAAANELNSKVGKAVKAGDLKGAVQSMDEAIAAKPALEKRVARGRFRLLLRDAQYDAAYAYGAKIVDGVLKDSWQELNAIAWMIVDPENDTLEKRDLKLALRAAERANTGSGGKNPSVLDTLARVHFDSGDAAKAIEIQTRAVEAAKGTKMEKDLQARLDEYKNGKGARG